MRVRMTRGDCDFLRGGGASSTEPTRESLVWTAAFLSILSFPIMTCSGIAFAVLLRPQEAQEAQRVGLPFIPHMWEPLPGAEEEHHGEVVGRPVSHV